MLVCLEWDELVCLESWGDLFFYQFGLPIIPISSFMFFFFVQNCGCIILTADEWFESFGLYIVLIWTLDHAILYLFFFTSHCFCHQLLFFLDDWLNACCSVHLWLSFFFFLRQIQIVALIMPIYSKKYIWLIPPFSLS